MEIKVFISGEPYCQNKTKGNILGTKVWSQAIIEATQNFPRITSGCKAKIEFILPANKYPNDHPYGSDLDNLLKRLFDALNVTVFADVAGKDGSIVEVVATKRKSSDTDPPGVYLDIQEI
jgi:Holliday junction resolvase RusA-like endonuclease